MSRASHLLSGGVWAHHHPLMAAELEQFGLPVKFGVPDGERTLMNLYRSRAGGKTRSKPFPGARSQR